MGHHHNETKSGRTMAVENLKAQYSLSNNNIFAHENISYKTAGEGLEVKTALGF